MVYSWVFEKRQYSNIITASRTEISDRQLRSEKNSYDGDVSHLTPGYTQYFLITAGEQTENYPAREFEEHWYTVTEYPKLDTALAYLRRKPQYGKNCRAEEIEPIPLPNLYISPRGETNETRNINYWYFSMFSNSRPIRGVYLHRSSW